MHDAKDGTIANGSGTGTSLLTSAQVSIQLVHLQDAIKSTAICAQDLLQSSRFERDAYGAMLPNTETVHVRWPSLNRAIGQMLLKINDEELFPVLIDALVERFPFADEKALRLHMEQMVTLAKRVEDLTDSPLDATYPQPPTDVAELDHWLGRLYDFANDFLEPYNDLSRVFQNDGTDSFPWIPQLRPTIETVPHPDFL